MNEDMTENYLPPLEVGSIVKFYSNPQVESPSNYLGEAVLLEKIEDGFSFIDDDYGPEAETVVYKLELWNAIPLSLTPKGERFNYKLGEEAMVSLKTLHSIGLAVSTHPEREYYEPPSSSMLRDKFLDIDGVEIF